ncbi:hypothetical protein Taro_050703 [Colocasia esculenta]|uniref:Uncharacterized protein n=1 Tax=Colocasia esculenta TaxID=4460 RepID=A0A843XEZ1_COLES|nr:hypothetical protein [Colocasia esculenta]
MATVAFQPPPARLCGRYRPSSSSSSCRLLLRPRQSLVRCFAAAEAVPLGGDNAGVVSSSNGTNTATSDPPQESAVGTSKRSSSLISANNVQKALRGIAITDVDHYGRLGISRGTSYAEVDD